MPRVFWQLQLSADTGISASTLQALHKGEKETGNGFEQASAYSTTPFQYQQGKRCTAGLSTRNGNSYSQVAGSSRSSVRAYFNNTIENQGQQVIQAAMHNAGERLQLIAPSSGP
jgi:hypothetical protein